MGPSTGRGLPPKESGIPFREDLGDLRSRQDAPVAAAADGPVGPEQLRRQRNQRSRPWGGRAPARMSLYAMGHRLVEAGHWELFALTYRLVQQLLDLPAAVPAEQLGLPAARRPGLPATGCRGVRGIRFSEATDALSKKKDRLLPVPVVEWELMYRAWGAGPPAAVYSSSFLCASSASSSLTRAWAASLASCSANLPSRSRSKVGISCPVSGSYQRSSPRSHRTKRPTTAL